MLDWYFFFLLKCYWWICVVSCLFVDCSDWVVMLRKWVMFLILVMVVVVFWLNCVYEVLNVFDVDVVMKLFEMSCDM